MGRGRKRHRRHSTEAKSLEAPQFQHQVIPDKKKDVVPEIELPVTTELVQVLPEDVEEIWPLAESLLAHELPSTDWTSEQLLIACLNGVATLWMVCDQDDNAQAAMVTILTPQQRCLVAICCGNNLWNYLEARHQLYDWAKEQGMKEVTFYGRDALVKLMPECKRAGVILRKEL
jgi:hypothetical protein